MPEIKINGRHIQAAPGMTVLEAAREYGFFIPTLCHHPGLGPYGACRLCLIEVKAGFRPGITAACGLPVKEGLEVLTDSPSVSQSRRLVAELLLARAPNSPEIREMAAGLGVQETTLTPKDETCILCGRCVRACQALKIKAISFAYRGGKRRVMVPFDRPSDRCLACQACVTVCPTGAITAKIGINEIEMVQWHTHLENLICPGCGRSFIPERQITHLLKITPADRQARLGLCPACRRRETVGDLTIRPMV